MKKTILIIAAFLITATTGIFAQKNSLKTAPLDLISGRFGLTYERSVKENLSVLFTCKSINFSGSGARPADLVFPILSSLGGRTETKTSGYIAEMSLRKYFGGKNGMSGFYFQPSIALGEKTTVTQYQGGILSIFSSKTHTPEITKKDLNSIGLRMGYQWVTTKGFSLDLGLGGNRYFNPTIGHKGSALFNCKLGYAF